MKKMTLVCMLAVVTSSALYTQSAVAYQEIKSQTTKSQPDMGSISPFGAGTRTLREADETNRRAYKANEAKIAALRVQLAQGWQSLGMSQEAAQQVAATYQAKGTAISHHRVSVAGKSDQEIATMLQAALAKKDFNLANQTLIAFQRKKLAEEAKTSTADRN